MDILELCTPHGWLKIFCLVVDKTKSPIAAKGYQHLRYAVGGHGFSGEGDGFVAEEELRLFCNGLVELADGHDAEPKLTEHQEGGGLFLSLRAEPQQNRISIEGRVVRKVYRGITATDGIYTWATQFGFSVMRHSLSKVREVRWIHHFLG